MIARRCTDVLWRRSGGRVLVLAPGAEDPLALSGLAAAMWNVLEVPVTVDELAVDVSAALDMAILQAEDTVTELLGDLVERGIVECHPKA